MAEIETKDLKKKKKNKEKNREDRASHIIVILAGIVILVIWLIIFALLIKWDVGGFGSKVMKPILKNVPYVNNILPKEEEKENVDTHGYDNLDEAVAYIKELEQELAKEQVSAKEKDEKLKELDTLAAKLKEYESKEEDFKKQKEEFYDEVVFSDKAPAISEYKKYYEGIDPANAEILYKQTVENLEKDKAYGQYASSYAQMKPKEAAALFEKMPNDLQLVANILQAMDAKARGSILGAMDKELAAKVTKIMEP